MNWEERADRGLLVKVPSRCIERPGLHQRLANACERRICTVSGAGGWGKSTAVEAWSRGRPTAWVRCHRLDLGTFQFVHALRDALADYLPDGLSASVPSGLERALAAVRAICSHLGGAQDDGLVLVIDDLQVARPGSTVARLVEALVRDAPEHLHLVLISRRELPFSLARPRGQGMVAEIDARDLAFDVVEIGTLLQATSGPDTGRLADRVWERTAGWPAAVMGAVELIRGCGPEGPLVALDQLSTPGQRFHAYLAEEVFAALPTPTIDLMRLLAVLGEVGPTDLSASGAAEGPAALIELTRQGLVRSSPQDPALRSLMPPLADYFESDPTLTADEPAVVRIVAARTRMDAAFDVAVTAAGGDPGSAGVVGPPAVTARIVPELSIRALGPFQLLRNGVPVPRTAWQSKKARDLLKMLVARRRPVPREQLAELLWPEGDPPAAGNRLSVLLSMLRDVLASADEVDNVVVTDGGAIGLDLARVDVDVEWFLADADAALAAHRDRRPDAVARLNAAVDAYTGTFLEDDSYPDWAASLTEELRATHIALLHAVVAQLRDVGDIDGVVRYALRLLEHDPYDEVAHLELVRMLLDAGRQGEARRHYQNYLRRMGEIGVDPQPMPSAPGASLRPLPRRVGAP